MRLSSRALLLLPQRFLLSLKWQLAHRPHMTCPRCRAAHHNEGASPLSIPSRIHSFVRSTCPPSRALRGQGGTLCGALGLHGCFWFPLSLSLVRCRPDQTRQDKTRSDNFCHLYRILLHCPLFSSSHLMAVAFNSNSVHACISLSLFLLYLYISWSMSTSIKSHVVLYYTPYL